MTGALANAINRHMTPQAFQRHADDWYVEPSWCWQALYSTVPPGTLEGTVLDPACGGGTGLEYCAASGITAMGSDIADRGAGIAGLDFLAPKYPLRADNIITNPPYRLTVEFAYQALMYAPNAVALLVPLPFLASQRRYELFSTTPVAHVVVLSRRPSMPPGGMGIKASGGKEDYVWIVWRHDHEGAPSIHWAKP
jgi:hypothetical protein